MPELSDLTQLIKDDPAAAEALVDQLLHDLPEDQLAALMNRERALRAGECFDLDGFTDFYFSIFGWELPEHAEIWAQAFFDEWERPVKIRGLMLEGFRGSTKSTVIVALALFITGHFPHRSGMIVCKNETEAKLMGSFMADIVELNPGWALCFPDLVPDRDRGWSVESGYHIKDTREDYGEWVQKVMSDHGREPTFLVVSVTSGSIGKHPTGWMVFDDIHDYKNTVSKAEMTTIVSTVKADILPTLIRLGDHPFVLWAFTPWDVEDAYAIVKKASIFRHILMPAFIPLDRLTEFPLFANLQREVITWDDEKGILVFPELMGLEEMAFWQRTLGSAEFARMIQCDLDKAKAAIYKYSSYPHERIDPRWPSAGGVDYASVRIPTRTEQHGRSHFAEAVISKTPWNTLVVKGGFVGQITQGEAENRVYETQEQNKRVCTWRTTMIESDGKGEEFINLLNRNPKVNYVPHPTGGRGKVERLYKQMEPWFEFGIVTVSDEDTPFLNTLRSFFDNYPNLDKNAPEWDVADAVYHALFAFPECLIVQKVEDELPDPVLREEEDVFAGVGQHVGY